MSPGLVLEEIITLLEDRGAGTRAEPLQELALRTLPEGEEHRAVDAAHSWLHAASWL